MQIFTLKVIEIKNETSDAITLCFKQPGLKKIKYLSGQYLTLIFRINGRRYIRPYSFSSAPIIDNYLEVTVKRVPNGIVSNHIHDVVKVDDMIEVLSPMGDFIIPENTKYKTIFLWGAGSGITPLMSIAKSSLTFNQKINVNLIYGNRSKESVIFDQSIENLEKEFPNSFQTYHFQTQLKVDESLPNVIQGRIKPEKVIEIINQKKLKNSIHFICGPAGLKTSVKEVLLNRGVEESHIFSEDFEMVKDPKDFEDIETRTINLLFNGEHSKLEITKGKSILEVALDAGLEIPYSCQTGNCSSCKASLNAGSVRMIGLKETRNDLAVDEFLLCCSHPLNDDVYLEV
jgi:ring-1,2-phenylacetyl-CoA epoxidase subunit PaaE